MQKAMSLLRCPKEIKNLKNQRGQRSLRVCQPRDRDWLSSLLCGLLSVERRRESACETCLNINCWTPGAHVGFHQGKNIQEGALLWAGSRCRSLLLLSR